MLVYIDTHIKLTFSGQLCSLNLVTVSIPGNDNGIIITQDVSVLRKYKQKYAGVTYPHVCNSLVRQTWTTVLLTRAMEVSPGKPIQSYSQPPALCLASCTTKIAAANGGFFPSQALFLHVKAFNQLQLYKIITTLLIGHFPVE